MKIQKLCNYDLLLSFETESRKLLVVFKDSSHKNIAKLNTCKHIAIIGVEILDRYFRTFNSTSSSSETSSFNENSFIEALDGRVTNVLKISRFCLEYIIWHYENILGFDKEAEAIALLELLCKILFHQGDFLECSIVLERILCDYIDDTFGEEVKVKYRYLLEFFSSWNLYDIKKTTSPIYVSNNLFGGFLLKELKMRNLCSAIMDENNFENVDLANYSEIIKEIKHSIVKVYSETKIKSGIFSGSEVQEKFTPLFKHIFLRLEHSKKYTNKDVRNICFTEATDHNIEKNDIKQVECPLLIKNQDNIKTNIFTCLTQIISLNSMNTSDIGCNPYQTLKYHLENLSEKLSLTHFRNESKVATDRRTRSKNNSNNEFSNYSLNKAEYDLELGIENPLKQIIDILNNSIALPKYNDKQCRVWIQTIPYYCYNLILSIQKKKEIKCDDIFSLNLNSNFPTIEQFDEMIINETSTITEHYRKMMETKINYQDIITSLNELGDEFSVNLSEESIYEAGNILFFLYAKILPLIDNFLLSINIIINKILKFIFLFQIKDSQVLTEEINIIFFNIVEELFKNYIELIKHTVDHIDLSQNKHSSIIISYSYKLSSHNGKYNLVNVINRLYYLLFKMTDPIKKDILMLLYNIMRNLIVFIFITSNIISTNKSNQIVAFNNQLKSNFLFLVDLFTIIKEKLDNNIFIDDYFSITKLLILFKVFEIPLVKIFLESEFFFLLKGDIMEIGKCYDQIDLILDLSTNFEDNIKEIDNFSIGYGLILFSDKNIQAIKDKLVNWKHVFDSRCKNEFSSGYIKSYSMFLNNNYLEYLLLRKIDCNIRSEIIFQNFLQYIYNLTADLNIYLTKNIGLFESGLYELLTPLLKSLILIMNEDIHCLCYNSIIVNILISTSTKLLFNIIELYESGSMTLNKLRVEKTFHNLILETIIINITCIHKLFMSLLSRNKLNIFLTKNLMNLLISLFDLNKYISSTQEVSSNSIINLMRYLTYLEFSFELIKDENKEVKEIRSNSKISDNEILKRHILSNYCTLTPIIENLTKDTKIYNLPCDYEASLNELDNFFSSVLNTKILILSTTIKFGLFSNLPIIESWFKEIEVFVGKYKINDYFNHWNLLYLECEKVVKKYSILNKSLNMRNLSDKHKLGECILLPEQETEYLEILGIILQLLYGIPVCPLPSVPFNKMPIYNQELIYDYIFDLSNTNSNPTNLKDLYNYWLTNKIIDDRKNKLNEIIEYVSPYSPLLILSCDIFQSLINCTSLTEKQYSDSKVKFYTSIIGLIERLFFKEKSFAGLDPDSIWNIIGSPLFYPTFMNNLNNVLNHEKLNYSIICNKNILQGNVSSMLYDSQVSDEVLNFYDNIMVISPSLHYSGLNKFEGINTYTGDELLFDNISIYNEGNKLVMVSLEPFLYCKYYYAYILDKLMKSKMNLKFLYDNMDRNLNQIRKNAVGLISFSEDSIFLQINWKNIKKYIPFKFLNDCFISCIPVSYMDRSSSLWNPSKFGVIGNNMQPNLSTLFKYLKWLNMSLFLIGNYDLKIITCCNNILKQIICELDDYVAFENIGNEYPVILKRIIAQIIYLLECEVKYFKKLRRNSQISNLQTINNILSITFDQIIVRFINIKGVYGKTNTKYLLIYLNKENGESKYSCQNKLLPKDYDCSLLLNSIEVISGLRKTLFLELIPTLFNEDEKWYSIHSNSLFQIHNCIWLPSFIESKMRFKLTKILISSFLQNNMNNQNELNDAVVQLKNAYCLSVESLIICYLILNGNIDDIHSFFRILKKTSDHNELVKYFNSKISDIYTNILHIYLNKFPEKNQLNGKIGFVKNEISISNIQISYSNLSSNFASILFYFYKSFTNLQSIKQFIIILIINHHIPLSNNEITEFKNLIKINSVSIDTYGTEEMINELVFDELNSNQTILKKNRLTQSIFTPAINQSFSHFSIISFILLEEDSKNLLCYYQKFFLLNKKIMNFGGFEHNKMITDHYSGLYLRRNSKYLSYRYKFMLVSSMIIMVIRNEIIFNVNNLLLTCIHSDVDIHACYNKDNSLENCNLNIFFPVYNSLLDKKCDGYTNIGKVSYYYLDSLNQILDHLIELLANEFKTIRQLPAVEDFEQFINDQIKNCGKKGINKNLIDLGVINWNEISESGRYNISLNIIEKILNEIIDILNFVDNISLPIDGRLFSNLFGLVILFHKYEMTYDDNNSQTNEFIQCIPLNIIKQLERQLGSLILINIPFSVICKIGKFKVYFEHVFISIFNKLFLFSIDYGKDLANNYFFEVINLLIHFLGISSNGVNISKIVTRIRGIEDVLSDETRSVSKRMKCDISLFD